MSREVEEWLGYRKKLEKLIETDSDAVLDILKIVSKLPITAEILKKTKIGATVNSIKKKSQGEVGELAKQIVRTWKSLYDEKKIQPTERNEACKEKSAGSADLDEEGSHIAGLTPFRKKALICFCLSFNYL